MKRLACALAFLLCAVICPPDSMAKNLFLNSRNFDMITPEGSDFYSKATFYPFARKALRTDDPASIVQLRGMALQGDFKALAALALIMRFHEQQGRKPNANISAQFWEDWTYRLLGEQEGGYMLGAVAQALAIIVNSIVTSPLFDEMAAEALHRAAKAGHAEAMFGLTLLTHRFPTPDFRMPDKLDFPIPSHEMMGRNYTPETLYWLGKAATNGSSRASLVIGLNYVSTPKQYLGNTPWGIAIMKQATSQGNGKAVNTLSICLDPLIKKVAVP